MFFYEGRTIRGIGLVRWALLLQLAMVLATGVTLAALALLLGPALLNPGGLLSAFVGIIAAVCGIELGQIGTAVLFVVGYVDLRAGRHEYGLDHARSIARATACFIVFAFVSLFSLTYSISVSLFAGGTRPVPAEAFLTGNLVLSPVGAFLAGLGLYFLARTLADAVLARRLRLALVLGVAGAVAGPILLAFATAANPVDLTAVVTGLLASAVAGNGICALSLLIFATAFGDLKRDLAAGKPSPALPRYVPAAPWERAVPSPPQPLPPGPTEPPK